MRSIRASFAPLASRALLALAAACAAPAHADGLCGLSLTTYVVDSADDITAPDDGFTTLREAVQMAMAHNQCRGGSSPNYDRIVFNLPAGTQVDLADTLTITGDEIHIDGSANGGVVLRMPGTDMPMFFAADGATSTSLKLSTLALDGQDFPRSNGAAYLVNTGLSLHTVTVRNFVNSADAAVRLDAPTGLYIVNTAFLANEGAAGGALAITSTAPGSRTYTIRDSLFGSNQASTVGGGIYVSDPLATLSIATTTISGNSAAQRGAGIMALTHAVVIDRSTLALNDAGTDGGGIAVLSGSLQMSASTVSGNTAPNGSGGGIYTTQANDGYATLNHVTVTGNSANLVGGVCVIKAAPVAGINGTHTIIAGNVATANAATNDIGTASTTDLVTSIVGGVPKLAALADNGGPTWTHMPLEGSPVLDAGDQVALGTDLPATDQRGYARVYGANIDIGAVEYAPTPEAGGGGTAGSAVLVLVSLLGLRRRRPA